MWGRSACHCFAEMVRESLQPSEIIPAGEKAAGVAVADKALKGGPRLLFAAALAVVLDVVHADAAIGLGESRIVSSCL